MAEEREPKAKGKKKGKILGLPKPVVYVGGGVLLFVVYYWYKHKQSSSTTSSTATPSSSSTAPTDTTGGYGSYGGYGGYASPSTMTAPTDTTTAPTDTTSTTGTVPGYTGAVYGPPGSSGIVSPITPLGTQHFNVAGQRFTGVSSFKYNGATYLGINNPAEAQKLEKLGVSLVHNPRDPSGRGLFAVIPAGKRVVVRKPVKKPAKKK